MKDSFARLAARARSLARAQAGVIAGLVFFGVAWSGTKLNATPMNNYVLLADAWLHGRVWVVPGGPYIDTVPYHGHPYVVQAPFPALLLLPLVAVSGVAANQTLICAAVGAAGIAAAYGVGYRITGSVRSAVALAAFAAFGTSYFAGAADGAVWFFAHVAAFAFSLFALVEMFGKRRGWVVGAFAAAAGLSRYPLLPVVFVYAAWLVLARRPQSACVALLVVFLFAVPWSLYNEARWGTLLDPGFTIWYHVMDPRSHGGLPPFSLDNVSMQVEAYFERPPHILAGFPWIAPPMLGFAITWSSFGLAFALLTLGRLGRDPSITMLWIAALIAAVPGFMYYDTGGVEYGMRHALDFEPFAIALLAFALRSSWSGLIRRVLYANAGFGLYESLYFLLAGPALF